MSRAPGSDVGSSGAHNLGNVLVAAAVVFTAAVIASATATVVSVFGTDAPRRFVDELQLAADDAVTLLHAGLLVGASLLLVAAEFHDVDTPWFRRALATVGFVSVVAVVVALYSAIDVAGWGRPTSSIGGVRAEVGQSTSQRIAQGLDGLSVAMIAGCAVAVCWLLAVDRIEFGRGVARPDDPGAGDGQD